MAATLAIYVAIVAAVGLLILGAVKLIQHIREENKSLKEKTEAYKLARYESQKLVKSYDDLIKRYDELSKKVIKTDEDVEALRALGSELESIEGLKVIYTVRGDVDIEKTLEELEKLRREKYEKQRELDEEMYKVFQKKSQKDSKTTSRRISDLYDSFEFYKPENFTDENYKKYETQA